MANPEFIFNAVTLAFPHELTGYQAPRIHEASRNESGAGIIETVVHKSIDEIQIELANFDDPAFHRSLFAWWAWAGLGKQYAFAFDSADKIDTTLDGAAASGQKVVSLTATAGIVSGNFYRIRKADGTDEEVIKVASISAGISITTQDNLIFTYASADIFRSRDYWPKVKSADTSMPFHENVANTFTMAHRMREDKGA